MASKLKLWAKYILLRSIPTIVDRGDPKDAILAVVDAFEEDETPLEHEIQAKIAGRVCKKNGD